MASIHEEPDGVDRRAGSSRLRGRLDHSASLPLRGWLLTCPKNRQISGIKAATAALEIAASELYPEFDPSGSLLLRASKTGDRCLHLLRLEHEDFSPVALLRAVLEKGDELSFCNRLIPLESVVPIEELVKVTRKDLGEAVVDEPATFAVAASTRGLIPETKSRDASISYVASVLDREGWTADLKSPSSVVLLEVFRDERQRVLAGCAGVPASLCTFGSSIRVRKVGNGRSVSGSKGRDKDVRERPSKRQRKSRSDVSGWCPTAGQHPVHPVHETGELTESRIAQREKKIACGKASAGYAAFLERFPTERERHAERTAVRSKEGDEVANARVPTTPKANEKCSRREFDRRLLQWRRSLRQFNTIADDIDKR